MGLCIKLTHIGNGTVTLLNRHVSRAGMVLLQDLCFTTIIFQFRTLWVSVCMCCIEHVRVDVSKLHHVKNANGYSRRMPK